MAYYEFFIRAKILAVCGDGGGGRLARAACNSIGYFDDDEQDPRVALLESGQGFNPRGNCYEQGSAHAPLANHPDDSYFLSRLLSADASSRSRLPSTLSQNTKLDTSRGCFVAKLRHAMRPVFGSKNNHT